MKKRSTNLAVSNIAWAGLDENIFLDLIRDSGVSGIEVAASLIWDEPIQATRSQRSAFRQRLEDRQLSVAGLASLLFSKPELQILVEPSNREPLETYLKNTIDLCRDLGGDYLVLGRPQNRIRGQLSMDQAMDRATGLLQLLAPHAYDAGCKIGIEALPKPGCDFITTLTEAQSLVKRVNHKAVCLHLDTGAADAIGHSTKDISSTSILLEEISSCQINDYDLLPPGSAGKKNHEFWATALKNAHYRGWLTIEMRRQTPSPLDTLSTTIDFVKSVYASSLNSP